MEATSAETVRNRFSSITFRTKANDPAEHCEVISFRGGFHRFAMSTSPLRSPAAKASFPAEFAHRGGAESRRCSTGATPPDSRQSHSVQKQMTPQNTARSFTFVEVPRIELGSDDIDQGLLRAQPLLRDLDYLIPCGP